jgi:hypothetical protein
VSNLGAVLEYNDTAIRNGSVARLRKAIFPNPPGTLRKTIYITIPGHLTHQPQDQGGLFVFVANSINNVRVVTTAVDTGR